MMTTPLDTKRFTADEVLQQIFFAAKGLPIDKDRPLAWIDLNADEHAWAERVVHLVNRWINRGEVVCVYENHEARHPEEGHVKIVSYGSSTAMIEREQFPVVPPHLPDIGGAINWRYVLVGVYAGPEPLPSL
jgi:hypothetical protein